MRWEAGALFFRLKSRTFDFRLDGLAGSESESESNVGFFFFFCMSGVLGTTTYNKKIWHEWWSMNVMDKYVGFGLICLGASRWMEGMAWNCMDGCMWEVIDGFVVYLSIVLCTQPILSCLFFTTRLFHSSHRSEWTKWNEGKWERDEERPNEARVYDNL